MSGYINMALPLPSASISGSTDTDVSTTSEISGTIVKDPTVELLKSLSRQAEAKASTVCDSCGSQEKEPSAEYYEGFSTKADLSTTTTSSSSSDTSHPPNNTKASTGTYLESLSRQLLNVCLNLKDPNHPIIAKHQSPSFRNKHDALPRASNRSDHHQNLQKHLAEQENFHVEIHNTSSEVDEGRGRGTVYLSTLR